MIRYALKCAKDHRFESWFASAGAYDSLVAAQQVSCPDCGETRVEKTLMTPRVRPARKTVGPAGALAEEAAQDAAREAAQKAAAKSAQRPAPTPDAAPQPGPQQSAHPLAPAEGRDAAIAALKREIEANSDYVGLGFAKEARAIHDGAAPDRPIYGEAEPKEAIALLQEGIAIAPLPFIPTRKTN